jgi:hypothetical protein
MSRAILLWQDTEEPMVTFSKNYIVYDDWANSVENVTLADLEHHAETALSLGA